MELELSDLTGYCMHGLGLAVIMLVLTLCWAVILMVLVAIGSLIGLFIGMGLFVLALGYINTSLADYVWDLELEEGLASNFFHGLLLFIVLVLVNIPWLAINYISSTWVTTIVLFVVYVPVHGYVGKKVAEMFEGSGGIPIGEYVYDGD